MAKRKGSHSTKLIASSVPQKPELNFSNEPEEVENLATFVPGERIPTTQNIFSRNGTTDEGWGEVAHNLSAPVELPRRSELSQKMIPLQAVEQLDESKKDLNLYINLATFFGGGVLGIIVNWVTMEHINLSQGSVVAIIALFFLAIIFIILSIYINQRVQAKVRSIKQLHSE